MRSHHLYPGLAALLLLGCGGDRSAGGGGFEGETIAVGGTITHGGAPLGGARVFWFDPILNRVLDSTLSGVTGTFSLRLAQNRPGWIEVRSGDSALERVIVEIPGSQALSLQTVVPETWTGSVILDGLPVSGARIQVWGSPTEFVSNAEGIVRIARTPNRKEWLSITLPDGTRREAPLPAASQTTLEVPKADAVVLDDFETLGTRSSLSAAIGSGWWFALTDSLSGGASKALPNGVVGNFRLAYDSLDSWDRTSLNVGFAIDPQQSVRYGVVGVEMASQGRWIDLSGMDSLSFMAKGRGTFLLEFFTETGMLPNTDPKGQFRVTVSPSTSWSRVVVRRDQIQAPIESRAQLAGTTWSQASKRVRRLAFLASDTASLQLDDLVLHGPLLHELFPRP